MAANCRKFVPNIFNKSKCQNCFGAKGQHSEEALENNKALRKVVICAYLFVSPGYDFNNPLDRTRRWQRRFFVLYDDGELTYSVDENPGTVPQGSMDMNRCLDVSDAESSTGHSNSLAIASPDCVLHIKGNTKFEITRWLDILIRYIPAKKSTKYWKINKEHEDRNRDVPSKAVNGDSSQRSSTVDGDVTSVDETRHKGHTHDIQMSPSLTSHGVRQLKHRRDKLYINGMRKSHSLCELSSSQPAITAKSKVDDKNDEDIDEEDDYEMHLSDSDNVAAKEQLSNEKSSLKDSAPESQVESSRPASSTGDSNINSRAKQDSLLNKSGLQLVTIDHSTSATISSSNETDESKFQKQMASYIKRGWLVHHSHTANERIKRWFVLMGDCLKYYQDCKSEESGNCDGCIELDRNSFVEEVADTRHYTFRIQTKNQQYVLSAMTSGIRSNWLRSINQCINNLKLLADNAVRENVDVIDSSAKHVSVYSRKNVRKVRRHYSDLSIYTDYDDAVNQNDAEIPPEPVTNSHLPLFKALTDDNSVFTSLNDADIDNGPTDILMYSVDPSQNNPTIIPSPLHLTSPSGDFLNPLSPTPLCSKIDSDLVMVKNLDIRSSNETTKQHDLFDEIANFNSLTQNDIAQSYNQTLDQTKTIKTGNASNPINDGPSQSSAPRAPSVRVKERSRSKSPHRLLSPPPEDRNWKTGVVYAVTGKRSTKGSKSTKAPKLSLVNRPSEQSLANETYEKTDLRNQNLPTTDSSQSIQQLPFKSITDNSDVSGGSSTQLLQSQVEKLMKELDKTQKELSDIYSKYEEVCREKESPNLNELSPTSPDSAYGTDPLMSPQQIRKKSQSQDEVLRLRNEILLLEDTIKDKNSKLDKTEKDLDKCRNNLNEEKGKFLLFSDDWDARLKSLDDQLREATETIQNKNEAVSILENKCKRLENDARLNQDKTREKERELVKLRGKDKELKDLRKLMNNSNNKLSSLEKQLRDSEQKLKASEDSYTCRLNDLSRKHEEEQQEMEQHLNLVQCQLDQLQGRNNLTCKDNEKLKQIVHEKDEIISQLEEKVIEADNEIEKFSHEKTGQIQTIKSLKLPDVPLNERHTGFDIASKKSSNDNYIGVKISNDSESCNDAYYQCLSMNSFLCDLDQSASQMTLDEQHLFNSKRLSYEVSVLSSLVKYLKLLDYSDVRILKLYNAIRNACHDMFFFERWLSGQSTCDIIQKYAKLLADKVVDDAKLLQYLDICSSDQLANESSNDFSLSCECLERTNNFMGFYPHADLSFQKQSQECNVIDIHSTLANCICQGDITLALKKLRVGRGIETTTSSKDGVLTLVSKLVHHMNSVSKKLTDKADSHKMQLISKMSQLLRSSLQKSNSQVSLEERVNNVNNTLQGLAQKQVEEIQNLENKELLDLCRINIEEEFKFATSHIKSALAKPSDENVVNENCDATQSLDSCAQEIGYILSKHACITATVMHLNSSFDELKLNSSSTAGNIIGTSKFDSTNQKFINILSREIERRNLQHQQINQVSSSANQDQLLLQLNKSCDMTYGDLIIREAVFNAQLSYTISKLTLEFENRMKNKELCNHVYDDGWQNVDAEDMLKACVDMSNVLKTESQYYSSALKDINSNIELLSTNQNTGPSKQIDLDKILETCRTIRRDIEKRHKVIEDFQSKVSSFFAYEEEKEMLIGEYSDHIAQLEEDIEMMTELHETELEQLKKDMFTAVSAIRANEEQTETDKINENMRLKNQLSSQRAKIMMELTSIRCSIPHSQRDSKLVVALLGKIMNIESILKGIKLSASCDSLVDLSSVDDTTSGSESESECERVDSDNEESVTHRSSIGNSHLRSRVLFRMRERHKTEIEKLKKEKDEALAAETNSTKSALDAMRKMFEEEMQEERKRYQDAMDRMYSQEDLGDISKKHSLEVDYLRDEISRLKKKHTATMQELTSQRDSNEKLGEQNAAKHKQLSDKIDQTHSTLRKELDKLKSQVSSSGTRNTQHLLIKMKDAEIKQLREEVRQCRDILAHSHQRYSSALEELSEFKNKAADITSSHENELKVQNERVEQLLAKLKSIESNPSTRRTLRRVPSLNNHHSRSPSPLRTPTRKLSVGGHTSREGTRRRHLGSRDMRRSKSTPSVPSLSEISGSSNVGGHDNSDQSTVTPDSAVSNKFFEQFTDR